MPSKTMNEKISGGILRNQHHIVRFEKTIDAKVQANLLELQRDLTTQVIDADFGKRAETQQRRIKSLKSDVDVLVNDAYSQNARDLQQGLYGIAPATQALTVKTINQAFTFDITSPTLTPNELRALARNPTVLGGKMTEKWWGQREQLKQRYVEQLRLGIAQGETNAELVERVIGKPTGVRRRITLADGSTKSIPVRSGGVMDVSRRQATALVRTSAQTVSNATLQATYDDNDDIIGAIEILVTLDGRTTLICMSLSGGVWDAKTGDPLASSNTQDPYPGPAPYHWQALAGDTMITTIDGLRRIDEIEPGQMVMTGKGRFRPCYAVHRKRHEGRVIEACFDSGAKLTITDDHPIAVAGDWVPARDLKPGDKCFQYSQDVPSVEHIAPPCGVADCRPSLLAEELVSDEVRCLPVFFRGPVNLKHHSAWESEVDDVAILRELEQVPAVSDSLENRQEVTLPGGRCGSEVSGALDHGGAQVVDVEHGVAVSHTPGDRREPGVGVLGKAVGPDFGGVVLAGSAGQGCSLTLGAGLDPEADAVFGDGAVGEGEVAFQGAQGFAAVDVAALDQLAKVVVTVPGCGFRHITCTSSVGRHWQGEVFNLSVVGDETYVANGVLVHNCRSVISPVTKSWEELGAGTKGKVLDKASDPTGVRASMTGERAGSDDYTKFLRDQSTKFQNDTLGVGRAKMFRAGTLQLHQLTDATLRPLTLAELVRITA